MFFFLFNLCKMKLFLLLKASILAMSSFIAGGFVRLHIAWNKILILLSIDFHLRQLNPHKRLKMISDFSNRPLQAWSFLESVTMNSSTVGFKLVLVKVFDMITWNIDLKYYKSLRWIHLVFVSHRFWPTLIRIRGWWAVFDEHFV